MSAPVLHLTSRNNPLLKTLRRLAADGGAYRKQGQLWVEGDHLARAAVDRGLQPLYALFAASYWEQAPESVRFAAQQSIVLPDALFATLSTLESPSRMAVVLDLPSTPELQPGVASVVLDRLQDPGNVGSILRSAAAFGFWQVIAIKGTVALWSPKVLRAGMGAHFGLRLVEGVTVDDLDVLDLPLVATSSHRGEDLNRLTLPAHCGWILGHEGQGASEELTQRASLWARIPQPGGEESLNVAAAAAICLYSSATARR